MAINRTLRFITLAALLLIGMAPLLEAQTAGYFIKTDDEGSRFYQRLAWSGGENALRYEVIIERESGDGYLIHERQFTTELYHDFALPPGRYRFRVIPYDILDRPGEASQWASFEVRPALKPEIYDASFEIEYRDNVPFFVLNINGNNLDADAIRSLRDSNGNEIVPIEIATSDDGANLSLFFSNDQLLSGEYEIYIENPGGLEAGMDGISLIVPENVRMYNATLSLNKLVVNYSVSWAPLIPIYGETDEGISLFGWALRVGWNFSNLSSFKIGIETTVIWSAPDFDSFKNESSITVGGGLLAQKWMPNQKILFIFRLGAGYNITIASDNSGFFQLNMGTSFMWKFAENFYLETGIDYAHLFTDDVSGHLRPWIGIGIIF